MELQTTTIKQLTGAGINERYSSDIRTFNAWAGGRPVCPELIREFFEERKRHCASSTLGRNRAALKAALLHAFGPGITLSQRAQINEFFAEIKPGQRERGVQADKCLDREELKAIKKNAGHKTALIIQALYESAARVSELVNIRVNDCTVQGEGVLVDIRRGKGGKQRTVFLNAETFRAIREAWAGSEYLFEHRGRHLAPGTVSTLLKRAGAHIEKHTTPHVLRHSWATLSIGELGLSAVSQYLGHASPSTTCAYYLHGRAKMGDVLAVNRLNAGV